MIYRGNDVGHEAIVSRDFHLEYMCVVLDMDVGSLFVDHFGANLTSTGSACNSEELKGSCFDFNNTDCSERRTGFYTILHTEDIVSRDFELFFIHD